MNINPVALTIGNLKIYWYGISYVVGFYCAWKVCSKLLLRNCWMSERHLESLVSWTVSGVILGGRLGYCLLYDFEKTCTNLSSIFEVWKGGMSFHGALIGVLVSTFFFSKKYKIPLFHLSDLIATTAPLGIAFGRIGNFINQEHYGKETNLPWGVVFEKIDLLKRHPSQLYEALLEGLIPFLVCYFLYNKLFRKKGKLTGVFLTFYALARYLIEFVRVPDGYIGWFTMGQFFSLPMLLIGLILLFKKNH
jgi:phosphatidylglycerol:prolipoprotein diacylglycerol transferase